MESGGGIYMYGHYVPTMDEMMDYQSTREPWDASVEYGRYTLYFCGVSLGLFFLLHGFKVASFWSRMRNASQMSPLKSKLFAFARLLTYPRLPYPAAKVINHIWTIGPLGPNILLLITFVFTSAYCWINEYYYRPPFYGSPPLALRSEWIACALVPFLFVLGAKRNLISWITGVSHDKLQVLHQGVALVVVYMSIVHTASQIVQALMERPWAVTYASDPVWWTGFAALGPLLWLFIGGLPFIRQRLYEGFYILHIVASILFVAFLYLHGFTLLDTNAYMNATIALFGFGFVSRLLMMLVSNILFRHRAEISLQSGLVRITIPTNMNWSPGMHFFIRFAHIRPFESHPFTVSSIPSAGADGRNEMLFLIRPETGFTHVLAEVAAKSPPDRKFPVILDGPYGETGVNKLRAYDSVLLLAGGTGITFIVPLLADLVHAMKLKDGPCKKIDVFWAVKSYDSVKSWESLFRDMKAAASLAGGTVVVNVCITGTSGDEERSLDTSEKEVMEGESTSEKISPASGRPDIPSIVAERARSWSGHIGVAVCGPLSFMTDAANAVSNVQLDILRGRASCVEMHLRSEAFGW